MAGEEVVGGIVGFLRMDISDFERDMLKALALVKALDGQDIKVDVKTNSKSVEKDLVGVGRAAKGAGREVNNMGSSFKGLRDPRLIVGALGTGMALLGPLTGAATAALGGFVGVVGTATLAFVGFKQEVEKGTALGITLKGSLSDVKDEFLTLGSVAARAMQGDVLNSLREVRDFLPTISGDVESLAGHLGKAFHVSTTGLLTGLRNAMPLLQDGGKYAEILAQKFADFTASQDFVDFIDYARRELPNVGSALGSLAVGIKDLAVSLSGAGDGLIEIIDLTGKAASGISGMVEAASNLPTGLGVLSQFGKDTDGVNKAMLAVNPTAVLLADHLGLVRDKTDLAADAVAAHTSSLSLLSAANSATATSLGTTDQALNAGREAQGKHAEAAAAATLQMQLEGNAAGLLKQSLDLLNGKTLNLSSAQTSAASATLSAVDALKKSKGGLDLTSAAGVTARQAIEGKARADQAMAEATATATGKTADGTKSLKDSKVALEAAMRKQGLLTGEVQKYIDKLYQVPKSVPPTKLEVQTAGALAGIAAFQKAIDNLHGKTVGVQTRYTYTGKLPNGGTSKQGGSTFDAEGSIKFYANGGTESHVAQIAPAGAMRVWAEPETGGEAYIPLAQTKRARSTDILAETNRLMGNPLGAGIDYERLAATIAAQMRHVILNPVVSAGSFDRSMGGQMR